MLRIKYYSLLLITILMATACSQIAKQPDSASGNQENAQQAATMMANLEKAYPVASPITANSNNLIRVAAPTAAPTDTPYQTPTFLPTAAIPNTGGRSSIAVTAVEASSSLDSFNFSEGCAAQYIFTANVTANGAGVISYYWLRSDGTATKVQTLTFNSAGYQAIRDTWTINSTTPQISGSDRLMITQPTPLYFQAGTVNFYCAAPIPTKQPARPSAGSLNTKPGSGTLAGATPAAPKKGK